MGVYPGIPVIRFMASPTWEHNTVLVSGSRRGHSSCYANPAVTVAQAESALDLVRPSVGQAGQSDYNLPSFLFRIHARCVGSALDWEGSAYACA